MKKSDYLELMEIEQETLNSEEISELKELIDLDGYFKDYNDYEKDLTQIIKNR